MGAGSVRRRGRVGDGRAARQQRLRCAGAVAALREGALRTAAFRRGPVGDGGRHLAVGVAFSSLAEGRGAGGAGGVRAGSGESGGSERGDQAILHWTTYPTSWSKRPTVWFCACALAVTA